MGRLPPLSSPLPGGFTLGALVHVERTGPVYEALYPEHPPARAAVLHPKYLATHRAWFERRTALECSLRSERFPEVFAVGETVSGLPVVVGEWYEATSLRTELGRGRAFLPAEICRVITEVAEGLDHLHLQVPRALHRGLSPDAVLRHDADGSAMIVGLLESERPDPFPLREAYLSPEELSGASELGPEVDVFSLATLAFELLTGVPAFADGAAVKSAVRSGSLPWLALDPHGTPLPMPIDRVLHRAWSPDPGERPQTAGQFAREVAQKLASIPASRLALLLARSGFGVPSPLAPAPIAQGSVMRAPTLAAHRSSFGSFAPRGEPLAVRVPPPPRVPTFDSAPVGQVAPPVQPRVRESAAAAPTKARPRRDEQPLHTAPAPREEPGPELSFDLDDDTTAEITPAKAAAARALRAWRPPLPPPRSPPLSLPRVGAPPLCRPEFGTSLLASMASPYPRPQVPPAPAVAPRAEEIILSDRQIGMVLVAQLAVVLAVIFAAHLTIH